MSLGLHFSNPHMLWLILLVPLYAWLAHRRVTTAAVRYPSVRPLKRLPKSLRQRCRFVLPALRIAFAHGGGAFPGTIGRIVRGFEARPDLCAVSNDVSPREYLRRIYVDSIVHDPLMLRYLLDSMGPDRIALGSDYPFPLGEPRPGELIDSCGFPEKTRARLLNGTALEWLDLPAARFGGAVSHRRDSDHW